MFALDTLLLTSALALTQVESAPCPAFPADPAELIPTGASAVLGVDVDALAQTSTGKALLPALRADLQLAELLEILDDCEISLERTYALTLARDPGDGRLAIVQARGLGTDATLRCLARQLRARNEGLDPWRAEPGTCSTRLAVADGSRAWIINDYTIVWARGAFVAPTGARLEGLEPLALPATLADEFDRLDRSGHLWLAALLDDADRRALPGAWASNTQSLTAAVDLSEGLRAVVSLSAPDVATTATIRELVLATFAELADRLDSYGVEHQLRERARVGIVAGVVAAEIFIDERELRSIRAKIGQRIQGRGLL
ncbi:hypothetical protein ENSA5_10500 [Enhygromyxa salina]|uniref:Uncharacterized protein n=1 Tax=Enhygromyxa salina TaxID=215803 RepID=A0A2S9YGA7_9BACT|nr:hypothetical protein [Enhygromyxa salina]PRQ04140.1 hypothetical protein ENSA5_10500 [Enhygromyxa salina]